MKLLVILTTCAVCLDFITAKSNTSINQEIKAKGTQKLNSLPTQKPETQLSSLQQQQLLYRQQSFPQQPQQPQYQFNSQPYRQINGHAQQLIIQQPQLHQSQPIQTQLQQPQLQQPQLQQAAYQNQLHAHLQAQLQPQLQQVIQKAFIVSQPQNRPAAMILIAQPAFVPPNVVYGGAPQHLVNYYQPNPQARYQFLQSNQGQLQQTPAHTIGNYVVAVPAQYQQNVVAVPAQVPQSTHLAQAVPTEPTPQPSPLQLAHIAQLATQQYSRISPATQQQVAPSQPISYQSQPRTLEENLQAAGPIKSIPPIITGFEHFSPEQQEKIKSQLSAYFGAPLQPLPNSRIPLNGVPESQGQVKERAQYTQKEFVPSEQVKDDASASSSNVFKSHYTRA